MSDVQVGCSAIACSLPTVAAHPTRSSQSGSVRDITQELSRTPPIISFNIRRLPLWMMRGSFAFASFLTGSCDKFCDCNSFQRTGGVSQVVRLTFGLTGVCMIRFGSIRLINHPRKRTCLAVGVALRMNGLDAITPDKSETASLSGGPTERVANARASAPPWKYTTRCSDISRTNVLRCNR